MTPQSSIHAAGEAGTCKHSSCAIGRRGIIIIQKLKCGVVLRRRGHIGEGKDRLIEGDMARDDDTVCVKIKTPITLMISGVSQEYTQSGSR
jgi:hypothetical protein